MYVEWLPPIPPVTTIRMFLGSLVKGDVPVNEEQVFARATAQVRAVGGERVRGQPDVLEEVVLQLRTAEPGTGQDGGVQRVQGQDGRAARVHHVGRARVGQAPRDRPQQIRGVVGRIRESARPCSASC
jgi:hypothetical protein